MVDYSFEKYGGSTGDTGTPGTNREIYSEYADGETQTKAIAGKELRLFC